MSSHHHSPKINKKTSPGVGKGIGGPGTGGVKGTGGVTLDHHNHHHFNNSLPMDLAPRGPSVVQLTPVQPVFSGGGGNNSSNSSSSSNSSNSGSNNNNNNSIIAPPGTPIISVNRTTTTSTTNLTLLPVRPSLSNQLQQQQGSSNNNVSSNSSSSSSNNSSSNNINTSQHHQHQVSGAGSSTTTTGQQVQVSVGPVVPVGSQQQQQPAIPTYQITRVTGVRTSGPGGQPQPSAITVTPISTSSLSANIRLAGATMNNGTWAPTTFSPIRAATITVGGRPVRPDGKTIHIPQGPVQHVTQLQVVDSKGTLIKPQLTTPIMNIRGPLPGGGSSASTVALPLFRATAAGIATAIQQRPQSGNNSSGPNTVHKVIHQSQISQLTPIQFVQNKNSHVIQTIPPSKLNAVCLTLPTSGNIVQQSNSSPVGVVARQTGPSLLVAPSNLTTGGQGGNAPGITKVYPVGRGGEGLEQLFSSNPSSTSSSSGSVTVSAVTVSGTPTSVVVATPSHSQQQHLVVHATPTINVGTGGGLPPPNLATGSIAPSYFVERNLVVHSSPSSQQLRPIALDNKKSVDSSNTKPPGQLGMIFTTTTQPLQQTVTIPLAAHQHINLNHHHPHHSHSGQTQILTQIHGGLAQHHLTYTAVSSAPSITVTGPVTANPVSQGSLSTGGPGPPQQHQIAIPSSISSSNSSTNSSSNNNGPQVTTSVLTVTTTTVTSNNSSNPSASTNSVVVTSSSCGVSGSGTITTTAATTTSSQPAQSPKSTHSPRPSILRKRELGESHLSTASQSAASSRVQRNLSMSLNFAASAAANNNKENETSTSSSSTSSNNKISRLETVSSCTVSSGPSLGGGGAPFGGPTSVMTTTTTSSGSSGISILKKEFQPPTEESSWQSVSSNSSSGSSTISTTSETAELQMQQQQQLAASSVLIDFGSNNSHNHSNRSLETIHLSSAGSTNLNSFSGATSNGVVKGSGGPAGRSARTSSNAAGNKALERVKASAKDKEDAMSPRKKPRKQQLTSSDLLEAASPEIYYQGKGKGRYRRSDLMDFARSSMAGNDGRDCRDGERVEEVEVPPRKIYRLNFPRMSLLKYNSIPQKPITNHFLRYTDVKAKEEKRPSITDLANQKGIQHRVSGWRLKYVTAQMDDVIRKEDSVVNKFSESLARIEGIIEPNCNDHDLNRVMELLKGNIQRCKVIRDQMIESRSQVMKILDHRPQLAQIINKSSSKRPQKKRDRL